MPRVKRGFTRHRRHQAILRQVQGHRSTRGHLFRTANQELLKSLMYAYRDRRARKREMRALWIVRINAAARQNGLPYNRFISGLQGLGITVDRKMLAELAVTDPHAFASLVAQIKGEAAPTYVEPVAAPASRATVRAAAAAAAAGTTPVPVSATTTITPAAAVVSEETQALDEADAAPVEDAATESEAAAADEDEAKA